MSLETEEDNMKYLTLNNGRKQPVVGLGTWKANPNEVATGLLFIFFNISFFFDISQITSCFLHSKN